ncbi:YbhN family protein [Chelativorans sp. J32]|uniref:lysylphosphatidylglycerol synthase transmembrane domain-containing protein n=1 Tax=Chelativorans sp. J32 TaxID=935840 RepID=UPI0004849439|nr:YbhN family protein [Chelativorans sp. J32]
MHLKKYVWSIIGLGAVVFSAWLLYHELRGLSLDELWGSLTAIPAVNWLLCVIATLVAYGALAAYDHLALTHLRKRVGWIYITITSFTTYALSHNIGASVFSGSIVRYRAYTAKGLTGPEVGVLVAFCSFTFALGIVLLTGLVLLIEPQIADRFVDMLPVEASALTGALLLGLVLLYVAGSALRLRPLHIGKLEISYPRLSIVARQLLIGPLEIIGAAAIIYFALPASGNPGFVTILGIFLISFSLALLSHAPGGLGVLELAFISGLPELDPADVLAALLVFRLLYLIIPFIAALIIVLGFERRQLVNERT